MRRRKEVEKEVANKDMNDSVMQKKMRDEIFKNSNMFFKICFQLSKSRRKFTKITLEITESVVNLV